MLYRTYGINLSNQLLTIGGRNMKVYSIIIYLTFKIFLHRKPFETPTSITFGIRYRLCNARRTGKLFKLVALQIARLRTPEALTSRVQRTRAAGRQMADVTSCGPCRDFHTTLALCIPTRVRMDRIPFTSHKLRYCQSVSSYGCNTLYI